MFLITLIQPNRTFFIIKRLYWYFKSDMSLATVKTIRIVIKTMATPPDVCALILSSALVYVSSAISLCAFSSAEKYK